MRRFLVGFLATLGALAILFVAGVGFAAWWFLRSERAEPSLPPRVVLELDLRQDVPESSSGLGLVGLSLDGTPTLSQLVLGLERAAGDPRVAGLVALVDGTSHGFAVAQELRDAIKAFRAKHRFALAWSDSLGELSPGDEGYYLATAFDEISVQPAGLVGVSGLQIETPFAKDLLDRLGIGVSVAKRGAYKTAPEIATESAPTPANQAMLQDLVQQTWQGLIAGVAEGRQLTAERAEAALGGGPYTAAEARDAGLVDRLAYRDEVEARALARAGVGAGLVPMREYLDAERGEPDDGATRVAFVRAVGTIQRGSEAVGGGAAADDLAQALTEAIDDPAVRAIVLRIASPGGSAVASETIAHQVRQAVKVGKPVIVSMGNVAASGGYWIAMDASRIVAEPLTLTGSIGVFAGKPVLGGASEKLGINWGRATAGPDLGMWSPIEPFTPAGQARLDALVGDLYDTFKAGVARGRHLDPAAVEALAQGRVWTGAEALQRKLVDRLGGLDVALAETRQALRLPAGAPLALVPFPPPETPLRLALQLLGQRLPFVLSLIGQVSEAMLPSTAIAPTILIR